MAAAPQSHVAGAGSRSQSAEPFAAAAACAAAEASPGHMSSKVQVTLSPGMTISVPSGRVTVPATRGKPGQVWAGQQGRQLHRTRARLSTARRPRSPGAPAADGSQERKMLGVRKTAMPTLVELQHPIATPTGDVGGAEEELRLVVGEEGGVAPTLLLHK